MDKFCEKCGSKLDETTGICPKCQKKYLKNKRQKQWSIGKKIQRIFFKILVCVFAGLGCLGVFTYFEIVNIPFIEIVLDKFQGYSNSEFVGQEIKECYVPQIENIIYRNESEGLGYVNNVILCFFNSNVSDKKINEIIESIDGIIIGKISGIHQYQIQIKPKAYEELESICNNLTENENIKYAMIDSVVMVDNNVIPNDPWRDTFQGMFKNVDWDEENPAGYNWWLEAVKVPSAWEYNDKFSTINVGVVDNGFDLNHEDLDITVLNANVNNAENHGTHVSGIIGATINNSIGISGILNKKVLYGVDCYATSKQKRKNITVSSLMAGICECLDNGCKVINMSSGVKFTSRQETLETAKSTAYDAVKYLYSMLDSYEDFIIVQAAGNGNKAGVGVDASKYEGYFSSIDDEIIQQVLNDFEKDNVVLDHNITKNDIKNAYMVVGAIDIKKKGKQWQLTQFSNYGSNITVCAPGVDIFSTIVSGGLDGNYGNMDGTSMAAPIVSGIVAMVWSVDLTLSSEQVQSYIVDTAKEVVLSRNRRDGESYFLINANAAVKMAINDLENNKKIKDTLDNKYMWSLEPTIEADDIFYLADYPDMDHSINELSKQADNSNAVIQKDGEYGIIDIDGNFLTEIAYKKVANFGDKYMLISTEPQYSAAYGRDWEIFFLDKDGTLNADVGNGTLDFSVYYYYEGIRQRTGNTSSDFVQEIIPVQQSTEYDLMATKMVMDSLYGKYALDDNTTLVTDFIYDECGSLSDGLFAVCQNGKWGYINEKGEVVIPIEYDASWKQYPVFDMSSSRSTEKVKDYCYAASDGYVVLCKNQKWELRDINGNSIIPLGIFEAIRPVFDGKCWVKKDGKWGVIQIDNSIDTDKSTQQEKNIEDSPSDLTSVDAEPNKEIQNNFAEVSNEAYQKFLNEKNYTTYISDWDLKPEAYAIINIGTDEMPVLIIKSELDTRGPASAGGYFFCFIVFEYDSSTGAVYPLEQDEYGGYTKYTQELKYSSENSALVTWERGGLGEYVWPYYTILNKKLVTNRSLENHGQSNPGNPYSVVENSSTYYISEDEYNGYLNDMQEIEFKKMD